MKNAEKCNTCHAILGSDEYCMYPSLKNMWFCGNKKKNSICCEACQQELEAEI